MNTRTNECLKHVEREAKVNNKLQTLRLQNGYTQKQIAQMVNITDRCYQRYEYGTRVPDVVTAINLAKIFRTNVESIFTQ